MTALWAACQNNNSEVVELLLHPRNVVVEVATDARGHQRVVSRTKNPIFDPSALDAAALHGDTFPMINDDGSGEAGLDWASWRCRASASFATEMLSEMLSVGTRKHYHKHGYGPGLPHRRPANMETPRRRVIVKEKRG